VGAQVRRDPHLAHVRPHGGTLRQVQKVMRDRPLVI
jgi:hypothetical protein